MPKTSTSGKSDLDKVVEAVSGWRFRYTDEEDLQELLTEALDKAGLSPRREVVLKGRLGRIDIMCGRVGIEVKVGGIASSVERQLQRYAKSDEIDALVLVTNRVRHRPSETMEGKPVRVVCIAGTGAFL